MNCFQEGFKDVHLFEQGDKQGGLYRNQIGAIGSALAHFSVRSEPALIAMPTGTGKTAVMILLSYLMKSNKVLVLTPSQLVREQIADQFRNPELLISKGVLPNDIVLPRVYEITSILGNQIRWQEVLSNYDVVVGIPGTINQVPDLSTTIGSSAFDTIFVDEAHHSRAKSWTNVLTSFSTAKQILLTATPFRNDKKDIKARLIYNYPLKLAYQDGLFSKINYVPVNTNGLNTEEEKNLAIAKKAEEFYVNRNHTNHKIIIRTDTKASADRLFKIYKDHTALTLSLVHSNLGEKTVRDRIKQLKRNEIDGIICVDMMGEGFDFPLLKIAAVHIPHKSLAITLQFIGRISRTNTEEGNIATVIAGEHEFRIEAEQLYKRDTKDWSIVLPDLHMARLQRAEIEQEFNDSFEDFTEPEPIQIVNAEGTIAIDNEDLLPFFHVKLYKLLKDRQNRIQDEEVLDENEFIDITRTLDFDNTNVLINPIIRHHHVSTEYEVAIFIVSELKKPRWYISSNVLNDVQNQLFIIYFDKKSSILFICATVKENELYEEIASQYLLNGVSNEIIPLPFLKRMMAGWEDPKMYNVGMKSRKAKGNSEAYKNILGSKAQEGVNDSDRYNYTRGHSFGGGYDTILQKEVLIGISTSSKVWSLDEKKIKYLIDWCKEIGRKVTDPEMDNLSFPLSELDSGTVVENFPLEVAPFFADWDSSQYLKVASIGFMDNEGVLIEEALLCSCSIYILDCTNESMQLVIRKGVAECHINYSMNPKIEFEYAINSPTKIFVKQGNNFTNPDKFLINLKSNPINIYYENLSHLTGHVFYEYKNDINVINDNQITAHSWPANVNVNKEFYSEDEAAGNASSNNSILSIHDYILQLASDEFDVVFYDHASLEIADVIGFKNGKVKFYHCKKQDGDLPRCSVNDIYEVNGQAIKSVKWANRKALLKQIYERADQNNSSIKIKKGTLELIRQILESFDNPIIPVEIVIVHPGLKTQNLTTGQLEAFTRIKYLFSAADTYMKDVSSCQLSIMCS